MTTQHPITVAIAAGVVTLFVLAFAAPQMTNKEMITAALLIAILAGAIQTAANITKKPDTPEAIV